MIKIICVGKIKHSFIKEGIEEYKKRLQKFTKLEIIEINDYEYNEPNKTLKKEMEEILKHINIKDNIVILDIKGTQLNSKKFSKIIENNIANKTTFVIGGSYGIHEEIKQMANYKISFSELTFPHQMFRLIFLEQVYRAFKIINNQTYHK